MHAADHDALFAIHDRGQGVGAPHEVARGAQRFVVLGIPGADRRGVDHQIGLGDMLRGVVLGKAQPERLQARDLDGGRLVRAAHLVPERDQQAGDAAHAGAGHADEVNLQFPSDEDLREDLASVSIGHGCGIGNGCAGERARDGRAPRMLRALALFEIGNGIRHRL